MNRERDGAVRCRIHDRSSRLLARAGRWRRAALPVAMTLCCAAMAETAVQRALEDKLLFERVKAIAERTHGPVGVATIDLTSGRVFVFNGDVEFPTASTIKIAIMAELFRQARAGQIRLDQQITVAPDQAAGGDGKLDGLLKNGPVKLTVRELVERMIVDSDNTATNRCIALVGMDRVNALFEQRRMRATRLRRVMMDTAAASRDDENTTSPLEMARLTEDLYRGKLGDAESTREMLGILRRVRADVRKAVPAAVPVVSKPGSLTGVFCETAVVELPGRPFVVSVYSSFLDDGENPVPAVAEAAFAYFQKLAASNGYGNRVR